MSAKKYPLRDLAIGQELIVENAPKYFRTYVYKYGTEIGYRFSVRTEGSTVTVKRVS